MTVPRVRHDFDAPRPVAELLRAAGGCAVWVDEDHLLVRFGPWRVRTTLDNVAGAEVTGPYSPVTGLGVRLSLADRGLTFGTTARAGVCVRFHRPVSGMLPGGLLPHPGLTVTVRDPHALTRVLRARIADRSEPS